jgi:hypothetical protein
MSKKQDKKHKQYTVVYCTKDYSWFKKTKGNRPAKSSHIRKIKNSIAEKDLKMVVYVNSDGCIREGHTTFEVRKELGLPIYYIINDDFDALDVPRFNSSRESWSFPNTLSFFSVRQKRAYKIVASRMSKYYMPIQETVGLLKGETSPSMGTSEDFKWGRYTLQYSEIKTFDNLVGPMRKLWDLRNAGKKMPRSFIRMAAIAAKNPNYNFERAKTAITNSGAKLDGCSSTQEYIDNFGFIFDKGLDRSKRLYLKRFFEDKTYEKKEGESLH